MLGELDVILRRKFCKILKAFSYDVNISAIAMLFAFGYVRESTLQNSGNFDIKIDMYEKTYQRMITAFDYENIPDFKLKIAEVFDSHLNSAVRLKIILNRETYKMISLWRDGHV